MQTKIQSVAFYRNGAVITRSGIPDGDTVTVEGLPRDVEENTLHIEARGGKVVDCRLLSAEVGNVHKERCRSLRQAWEAAEEAVERNGYMIEYYRQNLRVDGGTAALGKAESYFSERFASLLAEKTKLRRAADEAKAAWERASAQTVDAGKTAVIGLCGAPEAVTIRYMTATVGWVPQREVDADGKAAVTVRLKAAVHNDGGEDLTDVPAVFSEIAAGSRTGLPAFAPDYIGRRIEARVMTRAAAPMMLCECEDGCIEEEREVDVTYALPKITVPSGETVGLTLKEETIPATYRYYVPSFAAKQAYYVANAEKPLACGVVRVYCDGRYLGESNVADDGYTVGLGTADRITVRREEGKRFSEQKLIKGEKTTCSYTVAVRNDRAEPIVVHIADRVPVSTDKRITVDITDAAGGTLDRETGRIDWTVNLKSGKQIDLTVKYTVTDNT